MAKNRICNNHSLQHTYPLPENMKKSKSMVSDDELKKVMADFLEQGHVENILAMYRQDEIYFDWTGDLLNDERFNVRLGISVLFEELKNEPEDKTFLAIPSLVKILDTDWDLLRGEVLSVLAIIGTEKAYNYIEKYIDDDNPQIKELVADILTDK